MAWKRFAGLLVLVVAICIALLQNLGVPIGCSAFLVALLLIVLNLAYVSCKALRQFPQDLLYALSPSYFIEQDFLRQRCIWIGFRRLAANMVLFGTLLFLVAAVRLLPDLAPYLRFSDLEAQLIYSFPADLELYVRNGTLETRSQRFENEDLRLQLPEAFFDMSGGVFFHIFEEGGSLGVKDLYLFLPLLRAAVQISELWDPYVRVMEFSVGDRVEAHLGKQLVQCGVPRRFLPIPLKGIWIPAVVQEVIPNKKLPEFRYSVLIDASGAEYGEQQPEITGAAANITPERTARSSDSEQLTCLVPAESLRRAPHAVFVRHSRALEAEDLKDEQALLVFERTRFAVVQGYSHTYQQHWQYVDVRNSVKRSGSNSSKAGNSSNATESSGNDTDSFSCSSSDASSCSSGNASDGSAEGAQESSVGDPDRGGERDDFIPLPPRARLWHSYNLTDLNSYRPLASAVKIFCKWTEGASEDFYCSRAVGESYFVDLQAEWPGIALLLRYNLHLPVFLSFLWVLCVIATVFCRMGALVVIYTPVAFVACGLMRHVETPLVPVCTVFGIVLRTGLLLIVSRRLNYVVWDGWGEDGHLPPILQAWFQFDKSHQFVMIVAWAIWTGCLVIKMREHNCHQAWQERIDAQRVSLPAAKSKQRAPAAVDQGESNLSITCANTVAATDDAAQYSLGGDADERHRADAKEEEHINGSAEDSLPTCRICYDGVSSGRLISPCLCSGSMMFVHIDCLTTWRLSSANPQSFYQCDQCHYRYSFKRTTCAKILRSAFVLHIVTALAFLSTAVVCGYCMQLLEGLFHPGIVEPVLTSDGLLRQLANETDTEEEVLREQLEAFEKISFGGMKFSHLLRGLMVVGIGGSFWMGFCWFPPGSTGGITFLIICIGAIRVMVGLYRFFKTSSRWLLQSMENMVLEVGPGAEAMTAAVLALQSARAAGDGPSEAGAACASSAEPDDGAVSDGIDDIQSHESAAAETPACVAEMAAVGAAASVASD